MSEASKERSSRETDSTPGIRNQEVMANLDRSSFRGEVATNVGLNGVQERRK